MAFHVCNAYSVHVCARVRLSIRKTYLITLSALGTTWYTFDICNTMHTMRSSKINLPTTVTDGKYDWVGSTTDHNTFAASRFTHAKRIFDRLGVWLKRGRKSCIQFIIIIVICGHRKVYVSKYYRKIEILWRLYIKLIIIDSLLNLL